MTETLIKVREPFAPHRVLATLHPTAGSLSYGFLLCQPSKATFSLARGDPSLTAWPGFPELGHMVSIERTDGALPWAGCITERTLDLGAPELSFVCDDHAGALFAEARTAKDWPEAEYSAGQWLRLVYQDVNGRAEPPLMCRLGTDFAGGPMLAYTAKAESFLDFLGTLKKMTGWEWGLGYSVGNTELVTTLTFAGQIGRDYRNEVVFTDGIAFVEAKITQSAKGYFANFLVVGGSGTFRERPAAQANAAGRSDPGIDGYLAPAQALAAIRSPALAGTRVLVEPSVSNPEALATAARSAFASVDFMRERLPMTLYEGDVDMKRLEVGSIYRVRFADLAAGLPLERIVRVLGIALDTSGTVKLVAEVVRDRPTADLPS